MKDLSLYLIHILCNQNWLYIYIYIYYAMRIDVVLGHTPSVSFSTWDSPRSFHIYIVRWELMLRTMWWGAVGVLDTLRSVSFVPLVFSLHVRNMFFSLVDCLPLANCFRIAWHVPDEKLLRVFVVGLVNRGGHHLLSVLCGRGVLTRLRFITYMLQPLGWFVAQTLGTINHDIFLPLSTR